MTPEEIQATIEGMLQVQRELQETQIKQSERTQSQIESNAKSISALTSDISEMKRDRDLMYSTMRDLTAKIGTLVSTQTQSYDLMKKKFLQI